MAAHSCLKGVGESSIMNGTDQSDVVHHLLNSSGETHAPGESDNIATPGLRGQGSSHATGSGPPSPSDSSHKPSYLKLSCAVSGYGKYSHYSTYKDVTKRSPSLSQIYLKSELSSTSPIIPPTQMPRSVSSLDHIARASPSVYSSRESHGLTKSSPVIVVNGHLSQYPTEVAPKHGTEYMLQRMQLEENRIKGLSLQAEADLRSHDLPEEACGKIRAAIGKANLLVSQKFVQFMELCQSHTQPNPEERETKWEDLEGFWDMVKIQVDSVDDMFGEIELMRHNGWQEVTKMPSRRSSTSSSPQSGNVSQSSTPAATPSHTPGSRRKTLAPSLSKDTPESSPERTEKVRQAAKVRDEARRKMLLERRAAMKQVTAAAGNAEQEVEIFIPEHPKQ